MAKKKCTHLFHENDVARWDAAAKGEGLNRTQWIERVCNREVNGHSLRKIEQAVDEVKGRLERCSQCNEIAWDGIKNHKCS